MIKINKVNKYYNRGKANQIHVINNTTLELPDSGIVTLLGPSGCGKTTLLNAIGGLDKVNSGKIYVDGDLITRWSSSKIDNIRNAKIGYIFQNFNLIDTMSVFDNVAIVLRMVGIRNKKIIAERVNYCLQSVGIYQYRNKKTSALSGGQRQRVAIARAIVKNPRIIIADEPTGNLDSRNTLEIMDIIKKISQEKLVVLVTHERKLAEFYSDRIIEIKDGRVVSDRENDGSAILDYQLESKIYLRDMPVHETLQASGARIQYYSDAEGMDNSIGSRKWGEPEERAFGVEGAGSNLANDSAITGSDAEGKSSQTPAPAFSDESYGGPEIKLVVRGNNIYIDTGGKFNVVDESGNVELIDDHYRVMDGSEYEEHSFEYDKYMPAGFVPKYKSIYTLWNMMGKGLKRISRFKLIKKLLLLGFVAASMFTFYALSNAMGLIDVRDADFMTTNSHYITVTNPSRDSKFLKEVSDLDCIDYAIPGNSMVQLTVPIGNLIQTRNAAANLTCSVTRAEMLDESAIIFGKAPEGHGLVVDRMAIDRFLRNSGKAAGVTKVEDLLGRKILISGLEDYEIVGICDTGSPSVYVPKDQVKTLLINATPGDGDSITIFEGDANIYPPEEGAVLDIKLAPKALKLKKGTMPDEDFECLVSASHIEDKDYAIGKQIDHKMAGKKLTVTGYYTTDQDRDYIYTTQNTLWLNYIRKQKIVSAYAEDVDGALADLTALGLSAKINYQRDRSSYVKSIEKSVKSALVVTGLLLLISLIEMYLMQRSSFLSRIKEIGTLRAIGLKKRDVYRMFTGEILVITLITAVPGIAIMYYALKGVTNYSYGLAGNYIVEPYVALVTFGVLLAFNLLAGLLPVWRTMRKTPAEILARNDI